MQEGRYELIINNPTDGYILDKKDDMIVSLIGTNRPDLMFDRLKELVSLANKNNVLKNQLEVSVVEIGNSIYRICDGDGIYLGHQTDGCKVEYLEFANKFSAIAYIKYDSELKLKER